MEKHKYCPECCCETLHFQAKLFPDEDDSPLIWVCTICNEGTDLVSN